MKKIELVCPKCSAKLDVDESQKKVKCNYCGYQAIYVEDKKEENNVRLIEQESYAKSRGEHKAQLEYQRKSFFARLFRTILILAALVAAVYFYMKYTESKKPVVDAFEYLDVSFEGKTGDGKMTLKHKLDKGGDIKPTYIHFEASKKENLYEGEKVSVEAKSNEYKVKESSKVYEVKGLNLYVKDVNDLSDNIIQNFHDQTEAEFESDLEIGNADRNVKSYVAKPVKTYLLSNKVDNNYLYDVLEINLTMHDKSTKKIYFVVEYSDVVAKVGDDSSVEFSNSFAKGSFIGVRSGDNLSSYFTGYPSLKAVKPDIMTSREAGMTFSELAE